MDGGWIALLLAIAFAAGLCVRFSSEIQGKIALGIIIVSVCVLFSAGIFLGALCTSNWVATLITFGVVIIGVLLRKHFLYLPATVHLVGIIMGGGAIIGALWGFIFLLSGSH